MKYTEIILTKETKDDIQKRLESIVSIGMFTFGGFYSESPISVDVRFKNIGFWKEAKVIACEEKNNSIAHLLPDTPEETCLIRVNHPDCPFPEGETDNHFMEGDIFYFYGKNVRIRPQKKTFDNKFQLFKMSHLCKPPYTNQAIKRWAQSDQARSDMFFFEASVENEFA